MSFYLDDRMLLLFWLPILLREYLGQVILTQLADAENSISIYIMGLP
jgi:hypothetical protein